MLLRYAEQIFSLADAAEWELKELAGLSAGRLTVGASATLGVYFLPKLIARFHAAHPRVEVDLVVANTERVEAGLREHVFALGFVEGPYDDAILHARRIGADEIAAVSAAAIRRLGRGCRRVSLLSTQLSCVNRVLARVPLSRMRTRVSSSGRVRKSLWHYAAGEILRAFPRRPIRWRGRSSTAAS
jgi:DNA-binding transcriptional LysR family regulator